jgi:hypothetical protein
MYRFLELVDDARAEERSLSRERCGAPRAWLLGHGEPSQASLLERHTGIHLHRVSYVLDKCCGDTPNYGWRLYAYRTAR